MNVVYVVERFPERSETFILNELRELHRRGVHPFVVALYAVKAADTTVTDVSAEKLPSAAAAPFAVARAVVRVGTRHPIGLLRAMATAVRRPSRFQLHVFAKALLLVESLQRHRVTPDRLHAHFARASASAAMLAARILGCRFSFTAHAMDIFFKPFDIDRKLRAADVSVTVCEYNRRFLEAHWPGLGHLVVVPCGVDPGAFQRTTRYERRDPFTIVAVGRLVEKKGFDVLIEACAELRRQGVAFRCRVIGDGPQREHLAELTHRLELADHLALESYLTPDGVRAALEEASVFCLPCVVAPDGDRDSQPVVIKEAMAMELPVVGSEEVGVPEMVDASTGRLVPPGDARALGAALAELAGMDEEALRQMGRRASERVRERFSLAGQTDGLLSAWRGAVIPAPPR